MSKKVSKIKLEKIQELLSSGHNVAEVAKALHVSRPTIYNKMKEVNSCVPLQVMADVGRSREYITKTLVSISGDLELINAAAKRVMKDALSNITLYKVDGKGNYTPVEFPDHRLILSACAELREQLKSARDLYNDFYNSETFREFCQIVYEEINAVNNDVSKKILERLKGLRPGQWVIRTA